MYFTHAMLVGRVAAQLMHIKDTGKLKPVDRLTDIQVAEKDMTVTVYIWVESERPPMTIVMTMAPHLTHDVRLTWDHHDGKPARPALLDPTTTPTMAAYLTWPDDTPEETIYDDIAYALEAWADDTNPAHIDDSIKSGMDSYDRAARGIKD